MPGGERLLQDSVQKRGQSAEPVFAVAGIAEGAPGGAASDDVYQRVLVRLPVRSLLLSGQLLPKLKRAIGWAAQTKANVSKLRMMNISGLSLRPVLSLQP